MDGAVNHIYFHLRSTQKAESQQSRQSQITGQGDPAELGDDAIDILLELMRAQDQTGPVHLSQKDISESVKINVAIVDYHLRILEDKGFVYIMAQTGETLISKLGIKYLIENNKVPANE